jgi:hypothetical protein
MMLPVGTTSQRPDAAGYSAVAGMCRYNSTTNNIEFYNGTTWTTPGVSYTVISDQQFTGTGSQTVFTMSTAQTTNSCIISINGIVQYPVVSYNVSGTTLTFTEAPPAGDIIDVRALSTLVTLSAISDSLGYNTLETSTGNGVQIYTGTSNTNLQYVFNTNGAIVTYSPNVTVVTSGVATTVDSFSASSYSSAKYLVTSTISGTSIRSMVEVLVVTDGSNAYLTTYGNVNTAGNTLSTFSATLSSGNVLLQATTTNNNTILRIKRDYQAV